MRFRFFGLFCVLRRRTGKRLQRDILAPRRLVRTLEPDEIADGRDQRRTVHRIEVEVPDAAAGKIDDLLGSNMRRLLEALGRLAFQMRTGG